MSDNLKNRLSDEVKQAMRDRNSQRLGTLRLLQAAIKQIEVDERKELSDENIIAIIEKQVKQRKESIAAFEKAGRDESAQAEAQEVAVLQEFLPEQASPEEVQQLVEETVKQLESDGITGGPAMGKAMGILKQKLNGRADMSEVSSQLKNLLQK